MINYIAVIFRSFKEFMKEIWKDIMFAALLFVPLFMAILFHFCIPLLEQEVCEMYVKSQIIAPYYICFDLCIIMMTPIMFSFAGTMVILDEFDNGMARYLMVTPLGRGGYLLSRIGIMSIMAMLYACICTGCLGLSTITIPKIFYCGVIAALIGTAIAFFVIALAHNKVEGMALTKFSAFFVLGIPISAFVKAPFKYIGFFLPSFWATEFCLNMRVMAALLGLLTGILLLYLAYKRFAKRI